MALGFNTVETRSAGAHIVISLSPDMEFDPNTTTTLNSRASYKNLPDQTNWESKLRVRFVGERGTIEITPSWHAQQLLLGIQDITIARVGCNIILPFCDMVLEHLGVLPSDADSFQYIFQIQDGVGINRLQYTTLPLLAGYNQQLLTWAQADLSQVRFVRITIRSKEVESTDFELINQIITQSCRSMVQHNIGQPVEARKDSQEEKLAAAKAVSDATRAKLAGTFSQFRLETLQAVLADAAEYLTAKEILAEFMLEKKRYEDSK